MRKAWRVADVRAAEEALMARLPEGTLMQRAAAGLARRCALILGEVYGSHVTLLVGAGNNGGDALYAGAILANRGAAVTAVLLDPEKAHKAGLHSLTRNGGRIADQPPRTVDLVMDGIVGIGAKGGLRSGAATLLHRTGERRGRQGQRPTMVAVDVPSGIDVDTGDVPGKAVQADVTVTFGCLKPAHVVGPAAPLAGEVELVDIGLGPWLKADPAILVPDRADIANALPKHRPTDEKYTRGVVGIATGSATYPGAAILSTWGALAGPTGMVRYAGGAREYVVQAHPSVIATDRITDAGRVQAWVVGSGLGTDDAAATAVRTVLATSLPVVLDADALNLLVDGAMADLMRGRNAPMVLTPHDREFARLAGEEPGPDRVAAAQRLAAHTNAVVLLKGDRTIVATPSGQAYANPTGSAALATGGTGDVLAGLLGSLLAGGLRPEVAAVTAAYLHGLAGREAARHGPVSASDVAAALRPVVNDLRPGDPENVATGK